MKFLLKYSNEQQCFHYNYLNNNGEMEHPIASNNYLPITIIGDEEHDDEGLGKLMDRLSRWNPPFSFIRDEVIKYLLRDDNL